MPGLGASFGRGAATNYQQDLANSDCILFMGSNMAEAHPVGFRWPMKAKEKGATLIHVDPRFTRTSALCDVFVDIRAGSDIAFLGGLVNYVLSHDRWFKEYVLELHQRLGHHRRRASGTPRTWPACSAATTATGRPASTTPRRATGATRAARRRDGDSPPTEDAEGRARAFTATTSTRAPPRTPRRGRT